MVDGLTEYWSSQSRFKWMGLVPALRRLVHRRAGAGRRRVHIDAAGFLALLEDGEHAVQVARHARRAQQLYRVGPSQRLEPSKSNKV
jgi:hypothetical protein